MKPSVLLFEGTWTALATPFTADGAAIDAESLERLVEYQVSAGVDGLVVCGSTGEAQMLSDEEYQFMLTRVHELVGKTKPVIAGIGTADTCRAAQMASLAQSIGLDGVLLVTPPYVKPMQHGIIEHFRAVSRAASIPIVAYNIPGRTGTSMQPSTIATLTRENLIAALKDSTGSLDHIMEVLSQTGDQLAVLSGEDSLVHATMACGGKGVISASANVIPNRFKALTDAALAGRYAESLEVQRDILAIVRAMFLETNPIPIKASLMELGVISSDFVRLPLTVASESTRQVIRDLLC